jgi:hypothetical protein
MSVSTLFQNAQDAGSISPQSMDVLNAIDIGQQIQANLGTPADQIRASEVTIVSMKIDDSGSIRFTPGATEAVRVGHNLVLDSLKGSKTRDDVLVSTSYLNGTVLYPYVLLEQALRMDSSNYDPDGGTPLYDETGVLLGHVLAKTQEFADQGVPARTISLIVTDGKDAGSRRIGPKQVETLVRDMLMEENHIICAMGISDGSFDFYEIFSGVKKGEVEQARKAGTLDSMPPKGGMGIWPKWVLTPGNTESEIRKAFSVFSRSASNASQAAGSFSQTAAGGFGV